MALVTQLSGKIHRIFTFEPIDGPSPRSDKSSGWGLLTHDLKPKPRYYAIPFLNQLSDSFLLPGTGDGTYVTSLSAKSSTKYQTLLVNYDPRSSHSETVPLTLKGLTPGTYTVATKKYLGSATSKKVTITSPSLVENIYLEPNTAVIIEVTRY